ncbi:hypothetical protein EDB19DRAFT_1911431 [Suillus lakei]|nr:hypothetical protein EDB19DRAFT_1911431 [Suillus lakei]
MLPGTVEESKAQRLQRQQARFRDRGGAFVPSEGNALKDILLARTVSGESPSKVAAKSSYRHRSLSVSPSKAKRNKTASTEATAGLVSGNAAAGKISKAQTKKKAGPTTRKGKGKVKATDGNDVPEAETAKAKPIPKRRGRPPKTKAQASDLGTFITSYLYRKTQTSNSKPPDKSKVTAKLAEVPRSDDEGTLVEAPRPKAHSKRKPVIVTIESDDEDAPMPDNQLVTAEPSANLKSAHKRLSTKDAPLNRAQAKQRTENRKEHSDEAKPTVLPTDASRARKRSKRTEVDEESPNPVKTKTYGSLTVDIPIQKSATSSKRRAPDDDVSGDMKQPLKKVKVSKSQSAKSFPLSNSIAMSKPVAQDPAVKKPHSAMKQDTKRKKERPPESDGRRSHA